MREPHLVDYWKQSLRDHLAGTWRCWLRPNTTSFSMASQFLSFGIALRHEGLLPPDAYAALAAADREALAWLHHWSLGGPADAIPIIARHHYRPLFRAAAKACRACRPRGRSSVGRTKTLSNGGRNA